MRYHIPCSQLLKPPIPYSYGLHCTETLWRRKCDWIKTNNPTNRSW